MLFLLLHIGKDSYAVDATQVLEVLPLVSCKRIPHASPGVSGVFNYHGAIVPLLDLSMLALNKPAEDKMSTRIILMNHSAASGKKHLVGIVAERVAETARLSESDFVSSGVAPPASDYLGQVTPVSGGIIQRIEMDRLLPEAVLDQLFQGLSDLDQ